MDGLPKNSFSSLFPSAPFIPMSTQASDCFSIIPPPGTTLAPFLPPPIVSFPLPLPPPPIPLIMSAAKSNTAPRLTTPPGVDFFPPGIPAFFPSPSIVPTLSPTEHLGQSLVGQLPIPPASTSKKRKCPTDESNTGRLREVDDRISRRKKIRKRLIEALLFDKDGDDESSSESQASSSAGAGFGDDFDESDADDEILAGHYGNRLLAMNGCDKRLKLKWQQLTKQGREYRLKTFYSKWLDELSKRVATTSYNERLPEHGVARLTLKVDFSNGSTRHFTNTPKQTPPPPNNNNNNNNNEAGGSNSSGFASTSSGEQHNFGYSF